MTKQEIFDTVCGHLLAQKKRSFNPEGICAYRGEDGTKCAVGCLIPDENYCPGIEGLNIYNRKTIEILEQSGISRDNLSLLSSLQKLHDYDFVELWEPHLRLIAQKHSLFFNPRQPV